MKKILMSVAVLAFVGATMAGLSGAFFTDTETSTGNTFTAGAIDLGVDNTSYYNGVLNDETTWAIDWDISTTEIAGGPSTDVVRQFFNFTDLKPGDWGEDTISLHVKNNDSYLCADVTLTSNDDNGVNEPEGEDGDTTDGAGAGELAGAVDFYWWADDGDNVYEVGEELLPAGSLGALAVGETATVALADSQTNIWGESVLPGDSVRYVGKAWCFGNSDFVPYPEGNTDPTVRPVICDGSQEDNMTQTDSMTADISFYAVQSRNNAGFVCGGSNIPPVVSDMVDIGDSTSMTNHNAQGWLDFVQGDYGGRDGNESIAMVWGDDDGNYTCDIGGEDKASFVLNAGAGTATNLAIRHYDGQSDDSFDVYVNGSLVGSYANQNSSESSSHWYTTDFSVNYTGSATIEIVATGVAGTLCAYGSQSAYYGQVALNWAEITN